MQSVLVSVVAYFFLIGKYGLRVGDRVQIGNVTGEVIDLGLVRMHLMELSGQGPGSGLQESRQVEMIGPEADACLAQGRPGVLVEAADLVEHLGALEHAESLADLEGDAAADAFDALALFEIGEGAEQLLHMLGDPEVEPALNHVERGPGELLVRQHAHPRLKHMLSAGELADRLAEPADRPVVR